MTCRLLAMMFFIATLAGVAQAMLPPDAKAREPQLRAYYQKIRDDYEVQQAELQVERARARERAEVDIFTPPWLRNGAQAGVQSGNDAAAAEAKNARQKMHRILISTLLLILIGAAAGWARHATREIDTK